MSNESGGVHTAHTTDDVPFIVVNAPDVARVVAGRLCDVAPTILGVLGLPQPGAMTGVSLAKSEGATPTTSDSVRVEA